jgi:hypothetical protein
MQSTPELRQTDLLQLFQKSLLLQVCNTLRTSGTVHAQQGLLWAWRVLGCAVLWAVFSGASWAQASSTAPGTSVPTPSNMSSEVSRSEVTALSGVKPSALVRLRVWGFEVYDARLWTSSGFRYTSYAQQPFGLELQYLRRLEGAQIASRSLDEMRRVGSFTDAQAQTWLAEMRAIFPNVGAGDRITGVNLPGQGAEFWINGRRVGRVNDALFARLFFGIWLDERTSEPEMRTKMLQGLSP